MAGGRYPWAVTAGGPLLKGGGGDGALPTIFGWNAEIAQALPGTSTFTRASVARGLTTTDGTTFWYQQIKPGEVPLAGQRGVKNLMPTGTTADLTLSNGVTRNGDELTYPGSLDSEFARISIDVDGAPVAFMFTARTTSGTAVMEMYDQGGLQFNTQEIEITTTPQQLVMIYEDPDASPHSVGLRNSGTGGPFATTVEMTDISMSRVQSTSSPPDPYVDPGTTFNVEVDGVQYFNVTNTSTFDDEGRASLNATGGVVTEATGTKITDGGYLSEPAATNRLLRSNDFEDAVWVKSGAAGATDLGTTDIGSQSSRLTGIGALGVDDIVQTASGFTNNGSIAPSFLLRRVSTTGTLRLVQATDGASGGDWDIDLSAIGAGWVRIEPGSTLLTENTAWTASGGGAAGVTFAASAGGPLSVDVSFTPQEDTEFATSPIITIDSIQSRLASVLDTGVVIPDEFGALFDFTAPLVVGTGNTISLLGAGTSVVPILELDASFNVIMDDGGTPTTIGTVSASQRFKVSYGRDAGGRSGSLDGATVVTGDAPAAGHEGETFHLYATAGVNQARGIGHISNLYGVRPTDAELETLSGA